MVGVLGQFMGLGQLKWHVEVGVDGQLMNGEGGVLVGNVGEPKLLSEFLLASSWSLNRFWLI